MNFQMVSKSKCIIITCSNDKENPNLSEFSRVLTDIAELIPPQDLEATILNFMGQSTVNLQFLQSLGSVFELMHKHKKKLFAVGVPPEGQELIKKDKDLNKIIQIFATLELALEEAAPSPTQAVPDSQIDDNFVNPFIKAIKETFKVQCFIDIEIDKPIFRNPNTPSNMDIGAVVGFVSKDFKGLIALSFSENAFLYTMSSMMKEKFSQITPTLQDGAAELLNIICGNAKRSLSTTHGLDLTFPLISKTKVINNKTYRMDQAIPSVIQRSMVTKFLTSPSSIVIPLKVEAGSLFFEVNLQPLQ